MRAEKRISTYTAMQMTTFMGTNFTIPTFSMYSERKLVSYMKFSGRSIRSGRNLLILVSERSKVLRIDTKHPVYFISATRTTSTKQWLLLPPFAINRTGCTWRWKEKEGKVWLGGCIRVVGKSWQTMIAHHALTRFSRYPTHEGREHAGSTNSTPSKLSFGPK